MWEYNGYQFEFDILEMDNAERFEKAIEAVEEKAKQIKDITGLSKIIQFQCDAFYAFFDDVLGEGAAERLFNNSYNLRECSEAYYSSFIPFIKRQQEDYKKYCSQSGSGQVQNFNREQRRRNRKRR